MSRVRRTETARRHDQWPTLLVAMLIVGPEYDAWRLRPLLAPPLALPLKIMHSPKCANYRGSSLIKNGSSCVKESIWNNTRAAFGTALAQGRDLLLLQDDACLSVNLSEARAAIAEAAELVRPSSGTPGADLALLGPNPLGRGSQLRRGPHLSARFTELRGYSWGWVAVLFSRAFMQEFRSKTYHELGIRRGNPSGAVDIHFSRFFARRGRDGLRAVAPLRKVFSQHNRRPFICIDDSHSSRG